MTLTTNYPPGNNLLSKTMSVGMDNINEDGLLSNCAMLQEVASFNDSAIIRAFGKLNYDGISTTRYNIYIHGDAHLGDELKIESRYTVSERQQLTIVITIRKTNGKRNIPVLTGSFTFLNTI